MDIKDLVARCRSFREAGNVTGCLAVAENILSTQPNSPAVTGHLCWSLLQLGRADEAQPRLKSLVAAGVKSPKLLCELRELLAKSQQQLEDKAAEAAPRQPSVFSASVQDLQRLQGATANIRNVCMLAHVDHGKTSLMDGLIASNRIISNKQIGVLRYMDSREDEQDRGITMKASCISLLYQRLLPSSTAVATPDGSAKPALPGTKDYLVNLVDSPGHIDFCSEVSTAARICDGAVIVVDVVEGACVQTIAVLRQAWQERLKTVLVLNKLDRLITELQLSPGEAAEHIHRTLEQVNAIIGSFYAEQLISNSELELAALRQGIGTDTVSGGQFPSATGGVDDTDEHLYYAPETGNVVFASAVDGWAFRPADFADLTARKQQLPRRILRNTLWGPYYYLAKQKKVVKRPNGDPTKTLFVKFVLSVLWQVYDKMLHGEFDDRTRTANVLGVDVPARELNHANGRAALRSLCSRWLPLAPALFATVVRHLPSPVDAQSYRLASFYDHMGAVVADGTPAAKARQAMEQCSADPEGPVIVYVSKMFTVHPRDLPGHRWSSASRPRAVPPRMRVADARPVYRSGIVSAGPNSAAFDSSAIVVATKAKDFSIHELVAHCKTTAQLEEAQGLEAAKNISDSGYRANRREELQKLIGAGTATDENFEEHTQIVANDVLAAQAARVEKMQRKKPGRTLRSDAETGGVCGNDFIPSLTFVGAKPGFAFQSGARGVGYYLTSSVDELNVSTVPPDASVPVEPRSTVFASQHVAGRSRKSCVSGQSGKKKVNEVSSPEEDDDYSQDVVTIRDTSGKSEHSKQELISNIALAEVAGANGTVPTDPWQCCMCLQHNAGGMQCLVCLAMRPVSKSEDSDILETKGSDAWECKTCLQQNTGGSQCSICTTKRPTAQMLLESESKSALEDQMGAGLAVPKSDVDDGEHNNDKETEFSFDTSAFGETFIGLARVFGGTLHEGQQLFVISEGRAPKQVTVGKLFMPMGRNLEAATAVPAGNICAIGGLDTAINRCGTLASIASFHGFRGLRHQTEPIVRVAVTPHHPSDLAALANGLQLLTHADPAAVAKVELNGEHVLIASGEVHLQVCLKDLSERFAKVGFEQSAPVVPFRETVHTEAGASSSCCKFTKSTPCGRVALGLRAVSLPTCVTHYLEEHEALIQTLVEGDCAADDAKEIFHSEILEILRKNDLDTSSVPWLEQLDRIWAFGPHRCGPNILLNCINGYTCSRGPFYRGTPGDGRAQASVPGLASLENALITGFSLAALAGPLCEEPLTGVCFELHSVSFEGVALSEGSHRDKCAAVTSAPDAEWLCNMCKQANSSLITSCAVCTTMRPPSATGTHAAGQDHAPTAAVLAELSGAVISTMTQGCRGAFSAESVRLVEPIYDCQVIATSDAIGVSCEVLARRRAKVIAQDLKEGTLLYSIRALMPVVESLSAWAPKDSPVREVNAGAKYQVRGMKMTRESFSDELRKRTSGVGSAQLVFSHWAQIDADPFWVPTTEEEKEDFGEFDREGAQNLARKYIDDTRRRKGLWVEEKIITAADKQRTRARKKG